VSTGTRVGKSAPRSRYFLLLALACLLFAGQGTAIKFLNRQLGPIQLTFLPFSTATILLLPLLLRGRDQGPRQIDWADWRAFIAAGVGGQVVAQFCIVAGITRSLASNAAILSLLLPVISTILAAVMLGERITRMRVLALAIGLVGVLFLSAGDLRQSSFLKPRYLAGNALIVAALFGSAFYNVYCKGLFRRFPQREVLVFSYLAASAASLPLLIWVDPVRLGVFREFTWQSWAAFAYQAVIAYGLAMLLFFHALENLDATVASLSLYMLPVFGVVLAALFLHERLSVLALAGSAIVLLSTLLIVKFDQPNIADGPS
jgi:drug/metabolite transporter (DMT)-like permease